MELMARVQKILGKKIFMDAIIARNGMEVYAEPRKDEPSLGTLHHHPLTNTTDRTVVNGVALAAAGTWSAAIDCSAHIPVGSKSVKAAVLLTATTNGQVVEKVCFSDNNSTTPTIGTSHPIVAHNQYGAAGEDTLISDEIDIPVSSSRTFYYYVLARSGGSAYGLYVILKGYNT